MSDSPSRSARTQILDKVLAGDIDGAMAQTESLAPGTLESTPGLLFKMHLQKFLELVRPLGRGVLGLAQLRTKYYKAKNIQIMRPFQGDIRELPELKWADVKACRKTTSG